MWRLNLSNIANIHAVNISKALWIWLILMIAFGPSFGQVQKKKLIQTKNSTSDTNQVKLQLELSAHYLRSENQTPPKLDSAFAAADKGLKLARTLHNAVWENRALWVVGEIYFQKKDTVNGMACFMQSRNYYHQKGDDLSEANTWIREAAVYPSSGRVAVAYKLKCYNEALIILNRLKSSKEVADVLQSMAKLHTLNNEFSSAENELNQVLSIYKKNGYRKLHATYCLLAEIYMLNGNPDKEVFYRLETVKNMQVTGDSINASEYYYKLSVAYTIIGKREDGLTWLRKAIAAKKGYDILMYTEMIKSLTALKRTKEALDTIEALAKRPPPVRVDERLALFQSLGFCYTKLHQNKKAEEYYLKMVDVDLSELKRKDIFTYTNLYLTGNDAIAWFYINTHQSPRARKYLNNMLEVYKSSQTTIFPVFRINTYQGMYAVAYESHHYHEAIRYLQMHKKLYDSVFNADKNRQLEEFKIKYETDKRERDMKLLESKAIAQTATLQNARLQRNITFAGITMLIIVAGLGYKSYRNKQQSAIEINMKNDVLQSLLVEKDWLLKEVHHRVKNNLQIVMSLLNSQSAYLENNAAIAAIRESQGRVQAISLIHQKLYNSSNVASINIQTYVADLMNYLADSFDTRGRGIRFEQMVDFFNLDIAQAVPLGLILNESVTNAIKYAFDDKGGRIIIAVQLIRNENLLLTIVDNGKGLPVDFDLKKASSLGMEMMKALSKQLGGEFKITNNSGVNISIEFLVTNVLHGVAQKSYSV